MIKVGTTRISILIGKYCIKIPCFLYEWRLFLLGLVNNINEKEWAKLNNPNLAKIYFSGLGGLFNIMERCTPLTLEEFSNLNYKCFIKETMNLGQLPVENKLDSFGKNKDNKIVGIDYH